MCNITSSILNFMFMIHQQLLSFGWEVLQYPNYSPHITPSGYFLLRTLKIFYKGNSMLQMKTSKKNFWCSSAKKAAIFGRNVCLSISLPADKKRLLLMAEISHYIKLINLIMVNKLILLLEFPFKLFG